ncbi:alginate biosynthesis protein [Leptospira congkakensis]|uniref:Alginate biosynthesis protein n=1 Tax=Leptospira congkakensis TaxID=2484932 RepID=A0A4Z1ACC8_9LEPT|nr:alginate biosynthesis protein [Leptospira congkakensis]TGL90241.1 alginate biosynthesis protein [Leptospira congkakensis]TGL91247.1 alginate biosynthesis protein [Leptospira congkakensis]TGL98300.1 alginate biosynthesis protein [Leptospira congkakensis]
MNKFVIKLSILILVFPFLNLFFTVISDIDSTDKNKEITISDIFEAGTTGKFQLIENYFERKFPLRNWLIQKYNYFVWFVLDSSPKRRVVKGNDNWIFVFLGNNGLGGRDSSFDEKEFWEYRHGLDRINNFCVKNHIHFYTAVVPEKFNIYSEYLKPQHNATIKRDKYFRIYADTVLNLRKTVFFHKELFEAKAENQVYYKTDTHWNNKGAFLASKKLISVINRDFPSVPNLSERDFDVFYRESAGKDLGDFLSLSKYLKDEEYIYIPKKRISDRVNKLKILVIHDSYFYSMKPFFDLSFSQVDSFNFVQNENVEPLIELLKNKPDIVLFVTLERHIGDYDRRIYKIF